MAWRRLHPRRLRDWIEFRLWLRRSRRAAQGIDPYAERLTTEELFQRFIHEGDQK